MKAAYNYYRQQMKLKPLQSRTPELTTTLQEAARRAYSAGRYGTLEDIAVIWEFRDRKIPKTLPDYGLKVVLYTKPNNCKNGVIVITDDIRDLLWEQTWEPHVECYRRYINEEKKLDFIETNMYK